MQMPFVQCSNGHTATRTGSGYNAMTLEKAKELFLKHLRVFVAADKYCATGLDDRALDCIKQVVENCITRGVFTRTPAEKLEFKRFAVEEVFIYQTCFLEFGGTSENTPSSSTGEDDTISETPPYISESTEDFFKLLITTKAPSHPIIRVQKFLVKLCL